MYVKLIFGNSASSRNLERIMRVIGRFNDRNETCIDYDWKKSCFRAVFWFVRLIAYSGILNNS